MKLSIYAFISLALSITVGLHDCIQNEVTSKLDLSNILHKVSSENGWTNEFTLKVGEEYTKFLYMIKHYGSPAVPSKMVDLIWHQHILDTKSYMNDMKNIFGKYIHHSPAYTEMERKDNGDKFKIFRERYHKLFGEMPHDIWEDTHDDCWDGCNQSCHGIPFSAKDACNVGQCNAGDCHGCHSCTNS
eukprot:377511_1